MQEGVERYGHQILAFCFMSNHVHLAIRVMNVPLSKIMQNLAFRYTRYYNWRHGVIGHLFQGRFKSVLVDSNRYLKELIRYIHLNPVRANLVDDPLKYRWSSHCAYLMKDEFVWLSKEEGLKQFGNSIQESMKTFHKFVMAGIGIECCIDFKKGISEGILGDDVFVEEIQERLDNRYQRDSLVIDLKTLISVVTCWYDIDEQTLRSNTLERRLSHIRAMTAVLAKETQGISLRQLEVYLGRADSTMSQAASRFEARMSQSETLRNEFQDIRTTLFKAADLVPVPINELSNCQA
jgi:REP element-mobilizing transposase RayT